MKTLKKKPKNILGLLIYLLRLVLSKKLGPLWIRALAAVLLGLLLAMQLMCNGVF